MSPREQANVKRFLKYYSIVASIIIGIIGSLSCFYNNYNKTFDYPNEEYNKIEQLLNQVIDINQKSILYDFEVPENMEVYYNVIYNKPSVKIYTRYNEELPIYVCASFNENGELVFERNSYNKESLNAQYRYGCILISALYGFVLFLIEIILLAPIKKYVIRLGTRDKYEAIKNSYLMAGKK